MVHCSVPGTANNAKVQLASQIFEIIEKLSLFRISTAHNMETGGFHYSEQAYAEPLPIQWAAILGLALRLLNTPTTIPASVELFETPLSKATARERSPCFGQVIFMQSKGALKRLFSSKSYGSYLTLTKDAVPAMVQHFDRRRELPAELDLILERILELAQPRRTSEELETEADSDLESSLAMRALSTALQVIPSLCRLPTHVLGQAQQQHPLLAFAPTTLDAAAATAQRLLLEPVAVDRVRAWLGICLSLRASLGALRAAPGGLCHALPGGARQIEDARKALLDQGTSLLQLPTHVLTDSDLRAQIQSVVATLKPGKILLSS